jgi:hypothetical protein
MGLSINNRIFKIKCDSVLLPVAMEDKKAQNYRTIMFLKNW